MATISFNESLTGQFLNNANQQYQQYLQDKSQKSQELGFTYDITNKSYDAILAGEKSASRMQGMIDTLQQNKQELASLGLDEDSINSLNAIIAGAFDPEAMQNDLLTAVAFSENMGISVKDAMQNLDSLIEAQFFTPVPKGKTAAKAVKDSFYLGTLTLDRGHLGTKLMAQTPGSEEYNATLKQLQEIDAEMAERQDWMARPWYTELLKFSAQTLPYSMESMAAGGLGAGLVAVAGSLIPGAAPLIALSGIAAGVARFGQGFAVESGNLYYDLVSQGIDDNVARGVASGYGVLAATIEQALGGTVSRVLNGAGIPVKSVASKLTARMISSGALTNATAKFAATYGTDLFMQGAEEFLQSFSSNAATNLAYVLSDMKAPKSVNDMLSEAWNEGVAGVAGSLFLGGFGAGLDVRMNAKQGIGISNAAQNIHSKAQYENVVSKNYRPEGITDSDWQELIDAAWNQNAEHREMTWSDSSYAAYAGAEISANEAVYSMQGKAYEAQGAEEMKGKSLFFQDRKTETSAGTVHTILFGNPDQLGIGASRYSAMQKQEAQMDLTAEDMEALQQKSLKMPKIGEITYRTKGGTLEILSAGMEEGYADLQRQAVEQLISMYPDYDIQWKNPGELRAIYDDIVASNPKGEQAGLNYGTRYDSADTETVKRWIGNKFSSDAEEQSVMAAILQSYAGRMNLSGEEFISKYLEDIGTIDEKIEEEIRAQGVDPEKVKGFTKFSRESARAIIYAGKNADLSTFDHELNHVVMSIGENKADFEKAVHDAIKTNRKRLDKFIQQNIDIIKSARDKDGKYDPSFVDKLYQRAEGDTRAWSRAEEEFEAELFEAYRRKGETLNPELKGILRRIAEAYRRIYRALRNALGTSLNEEIRDYYDRLHGFDRTGADQGRNFSGWKITPNLSLSQEESDSIASQSYADQFAYIRDKYVGTEAYMRAPNGSASNLTEEQWIMVRTPNFKKWFGDWENDPENASKVLDENGEPREVYHGTYGGEFDVFDIEKGNFESDMGRGFYFTSDYSDMSDNYEEGGPDFDNKIERLAEALMTNDEDLDSDEAREQAREILFVGGNSFDVFLNMRNPAYVNSTRLFEFESSLDIDDFVDEDEYYDAVNEEIEQEFADAIDNAISMAQDEGINFDEDELRGILGELAYEGVGISEAKERLMVYSSADNGDFADNELLRCVIEACGFDGIIDSTVSDKFANMNIEEGTSHFIAFKPNQIKSATDNSGAFSAGNDSILFQNESFDEAKKVLLGISPSKQFWQYDEKERAAFITVYIDHGDYIPDELYPNLFIEKNRNNPKSKQDEETLKKELTSARQLAAKGYEIYLLSNDMSVDGVIANRHNPDAFINALFLDFKKPDKYKNGSIKNSVRNGLAQADVVFIDISEVIIDAKDIKAKIEDQIRRYKKNDAKTKELLNRKDVIVLTKSGYFCYEIKNGEVSSDISIESMRLLINQNPQSNLMVRSNIDSVNALFQEETPKEIWLEDIQNIANGCTDYEQFRIAVDAFAMGEPTESAEADMLAAWKNRKAPSSSYTNSPDEEPIDWEADWDTLAVDYGEHTDYEMYDDDTEEFIITSWAMARGTDGEEAETARTTLENPNSYHVSREDRQDDFVAILDHDDQLYAYLSALRRASRTIAFGSERDLDFDPAAEPERYERLKEASQKIQQEVAPFVRNVIFGKDDASWDIKSLPDRTKSIIRGIIANNPGDYMDLYYLASNNEYWHDSMDLQSEIEQEAARIAAEKGLTIAEKRKLVQELGDKDLEEKIIRTGDITNADVRGLLIRKRQRAEEARKEYELIQDMLNERIAYKDGKIVQITLQAKEAQESLYKVGKELSEVNAQLEHAAARLSKKAKGMGLDTKIVQEQQELIRKKAHLERLYSQRSSILRNLFNEGKYYGRAGEQKISEIDARIGSLLDEIVALEQSEVLTQDEAIEKIISLTSLIDDKKARDRLYKTVTLERWKAAKKLKEERAKAEKKLHDTIYVERLKASNAIKAEQQKAEDRLLAQRMHDAVIYGRAYGRKIQKLEDAIKSMKQAKAQERAARKLKKEMQRLADGIMRKPSAAIHLDEAEQILKIQMAFDPAFRSKMRVAGSMMDINDLKDMLKNDPSNPLLTMLTEEQLRRLLKKSLDEMSLAELQAIAESVKNLREKGRAKREAYLINQRIETRNIQSLLIQQLMSSSKYKEPEFHGSLEERERRKSDRWRALYLSTYSMARQAQMLDDDHKGNFYNLLIRRKRDRQNEEARAILARRKPVEDAVEINGISFDDFYSESVEVSIDGKNATFTLSQLAYVYLAKNNEKNRAAVAYGNLISQAEKGAVENGVKARIIGTGKDFEQARRDAVNEEIRKIGDRRYAELYAYAEEAINGNPAAKAVVAEIEASLNSDRFSDVVELMRREFNMEVTREAYYLPLNRVGFVGESPAERLQADILNQVPGMRATVNKGSTIARQIISPLHQSEVDLDLIKVWDNSIYDQEHLLAFLEYARLLDHVFKAGLSGRTRELREAIENSHGPAMMKSIDAFINEVANPSSAVIARDMNLLGKIMRLLRGNMYAATFGFRVSSVLNQLITSPAAFLGKVNPLELSRSAMMFMAHPIEMWNRVCELSAFMANRDADIILGRFREAAEKQGQSKAQAAYSEFIDIAMKGMEWSDRYTVGIGWYAIFEKELKALGGVESPENIAKAVKVADEYVQETQPQGDETELSALVKNDAFSLIAPFQTALNTVWQDVTYDIPVAFKEGRYAEAIGKMTGYAIAGVLLALVHGELQPDEDDEKRGLAIARRIFFGATTQFTEPFPLVGDMISNLFQLVITGEKEMLYNSSDFPALDTIYKGVQAAYDKKWAKALESIIYGAGQLFGAPISEIKDIRRAIENEDIRAIFGWRD